jgi:hypothetical protein
LDRSDTMASMNPCIQRIYRQKTFHWKYIPSDTDYFLSTSEGPVCTYPLVYYKVRCPNEVDTCLILKQLHEWAWNDYSTTTPRHQEDRPELYSIIKDSIHNIMLETYKQEKCPRRPELTLYGQISYHTRLFCFIFTLICMANSSTEESIFGESTYWKSPYSHPFTMVHLYQLLTSLDRVETMTTKLIYKITSKYLKVNHFPLRVIYDSSFYEPDSLDSLLSKLSNQRVMKSMDPYLFYYNRSIPIYIRTRAMDCLNDILKDYDVPERTSKSACNKK